MQIERGLVDSGKWREGVVYFREGIAITTQHIRKRN